MAPSRAPEVQHGPPCYLSRPQDALHGAQVGPKTFNSIPTSAPRTEHWEPNVCKKKEFREHELPRICTAFDLAPRNLDFAAFDLDLLISFDSIDPLVSMVSKPWIPRIPKDRRMDAGAHNLSDTWRP